MPELEAARALFKAGRFADAEASLRAAVGEGPLDPQARALLDELRLMQGRVVAPEDPAAAVALAQRLATRQGPFALQGSDEGPRLEAAASLVLGVLDRLPQAAAPAAARILWRAGYFDAAASLGSLAELGRYCARNGTPTGLLHQLPRVETDADRLEVIHQHRLWGDELERTAARDPLRPRPRRRAEAPYRLGFLSSDLRNHVVAYFAQPLFLHLDPRFELFCYSSYRGPADEAQRWISGRVAAFRLLPEGDRDAAEMIAADNLDLLIDLGGPTASGRAGVLAYRPAPVQASWMGYPHSLGLSAIDYVVADPLLIPPRRELILEQPLLMPDCWICMAPAAFHERSQMDPVPPVARTGRVTFGTAGDPYKYSPRLLRTWARVVASVPDARFMVIRPEAGAPAFRDNFARHFAAEGVARERLDFRAVRGGVRQQYADMDIALDTFPVTGGTTTCEALWMGVPTVTLTGPAMFERLSYSLLVNAGLPELAAATIDDYVGAAIALAEDHARLAELRRTMRERIRGRPLGQPGPFAAAFYDLMAQAIRQSNV